MGDSCKDCVYVEALKKRVEVLEEDSRNSKEKISKLERKTDVEKERTDMIFNILKEIKGSIEKIADKIEDIESRPNKLLWTVTGTIIGAIVMAGITHL